LSIGKRGSSPFFNKLGIDYEKPITSDNLLILLDRFAHDLFIFGEKKQSKEWELLQ